MPLLNFSFAMIYIINKMLLLLKNNLHFFKGNIFEYFFKEYENKTLSVEEYFGEIRSYLDYIINNLKKCNL